MKIYKVNSLPLKDVIESLAKSLEVPYKENCQEYYLKIPPTLGEGEIRGINFDNGLGIIIYKLQFLDDVRIDFTVDDIHPVKYIYSVEGPVCHSFANESISHHIEKYKCAIVASERKNGHILAFKKNIYTEIVSLEIDRKKFSVNTACEIDGLAPQLKNLFKDTKAEKTFYHEGFYGLEFKNLLSHVSKYKNKRLARKFYLESTALQIFVNQLIQFEDDLLNDTDRTLLRANELNRVEDISIYIKKNLSDDLSISNLSRMTGLNPGKLQMAFKYLFQTTVNGYIVNAKMDLALTLLKDPTLSISEVVARIGFESNSYFSKIFKDKFNLSPSAYKNLQL